MPKHKNDWIKRGSRARLSKIVLSRSLNHIKLEHFDNLTVKVVKILYYPPHLKRCVVKIKGSSARIVASDADLEV